MSRPRKQTKPRKARVPDLNAEVARALGAITGTEVPKGEDLLGSEEALRELAKAKASTGTSKR